MFLKEKTSGRTWSLDPERIYRLGRGSDQDIQLDEASVSRSHAELVWNGEAWQIKDCNSRFGIFVCERRCETQAIQIGDTFRLGSNPGITLQLESVATQRATQRCYFPTAPAKPPFSLENFQGQLAFKESLANSAELILNASLSNPVQGILLLAGPGRGQRFLVRCLSDQLSQERGVSFTFLSRNLQDAKNLAQSRKLIRKWFKQATKKAPAVLLIQNFEQFYQYFDEAAQDKRPSAGKLTWWQKFITFLGFADFRSEADKARQIQKQLTTDLQKAWRWNVQKTDKVLVVAAANNPENLPETVRQPGQRFSYVLQLNRPDPAGTQAILEKYLHKTGLAIANDLSLEKLVTRLGRCDSRDIQQLVKNAERHSYENRNPDSHNLFFRWSDFESFLPVASEKLWEPIFLQPETLDKLRALGKLLREYDLADATTPPKGLLLSGPAGTGKTAIARILAKDAHCYFQVVTPSIIKSSLVGQGVKNLQAIFREARAQAPAILFFDEIDALFPRRDEQSGDPTTLEIVNQFLQEVDGFVPSTGVFVLGATNRPAQVDPAVRSRLQEELIIALPDLPERIGLLQHFLLRSQTSKHSLDIEVNLEYYAQLLVGKSGRDISAIASRIVAAAQTESLQSELNSISPSTTGRSGATPVRLILKREHFEQVLLPRLTGELTGVVLPSGLKTDLLQALQQFLRAFADPRIRPPAGLLLSGPPGTGKTEIARAIARLGNIQFQAIAASDVQTRYVGEGERKLARIFEQARSNAPTVLFFDEIDGLFPPRGEGSAQYEIRLVNQFLQEVDGAKQTGRGVFILGATNRPEQVDPAVRSRLSKTLEIPLPELPERIAMLKLFLGDREVDPNLNWSVIAKLLQGKSGRAIRARVEEAYHLAGVDGEIKPLTREHFRQAVLNTASIAQIPDLVLSPPIMVQIQQKLETLCHLPQALSLGLPVPKGLLLNGPPGTGKTQIARYLAAHAGLFFRDVKPSEVRSPYQGGSLKNLQNIFADARDRAPCILFFDEIDAMFPRRTDDVSRAEIELINEFLQQIDGVGQSNAGIFILGATNRGESLDPAVISRLQQTLNIPLPGDRERAILLTQALAQKSWQLGKNVDLKAVSNLLQGKSGRDIQATLVRVGEAYIQRVGWENSGVVLTQTDFETALFSAVETDPDAWNELILEPALKSTLQTTVQRYLRFFRDPIPGISAPKGFMLQGPPGTGKTQVARVLARATGCRFFALPLTEIRSQFMGAAPQKLSQIFEQARREAPAILFIDEIEALFPKRESTSSTTEIDLINQFLQELDGFAGTSGVLVVGATNFISRVDDAVRSRLNKIIEIPLPALPQIQEMLRAFTQELPISKDFDWFAITNLLQGKSGRDIRQLVSEVGQYAAEQLNPNEPLIITAEHFTTVLQAKTPQGTLTWKDVSLPPEIEQELKRLVKFVANYTQLPPSIKPPTGALLAGPPGTGKTQIARVLASVSRLHFKSCTPSEIRSKYVGQGAQNLGDLFKEARQQSPAILFFDEIESLFPRRGDLGSSGADLENQNLVNQFLQEVDGIRTQAGYVFILAATNYPENIDPAVRSRLLPEIFIPLPAYPQRLQILKSKIHPDWQLANDVDLSTYAQLLENRSGRCLALGIEKAAQLAFDDWTDGALTLCDHHFRKGLNIEVGPSAST